MSPARFAWCSGAFSAVKLATNRKTGEKCAVKMVNKNHPEFTTESGEVHLPLTWFWATFSAME